MKQPYENFDTAPRIVTTSWDDGDIADLRLAELLAKYQLKGTFYVPLAFDRPVIQRSQMEHLLSLGMEIGSHTLTHANLTESPQAFQEMLDSRLRLEDMLGVEIRSIAYPRGLVNRGLTRQAAAAGYKLARTTVTFRTGLRFDPFLMPTSLQFLRHDRLVHIAHALKGGNLGGLSKWFWRWQMEEEPGRLTDLAFLDILRRGGILHIWEHSWKIEQCNLWDELERALKRIASIPGIKYLTNFESLEAANCANTGRS